MLRTFPRIVCGRPMKRAQLAGPATGAALFAAGMALPFVSESVCVLAGVLLISRVRLPAHLGRARPARVREDIREE
jgi:hypothetical protein